MPDNTLAPELAELLGELFIEGRSRLFDITPHQERSQLLERGPLVGGATAGLASAERELIEVHRCELARLLHQAFWIEFDREARGAHRVERLGPMPRTQSWREEAPLLLENLPACPTLAQGAVLARGCLDRAHAAPEQGVASPPGNLLLVALRLEDTEHARNDLALDLIERRRHQDARRLLKAQLEGPVSRDFRWLSWLNLGHSRVLAGEPSEALMAYTEAAVHEESGASALANAFALALRTADSRAARELAGRLDALACRDNPSVRLFLGVLAGSEITETEIENTRGLLRGSGLVLGDVPGAIADAITN